MTNQIICRFIVKSIDLKTRSVLIGLSRRTHFKFKPIQVKQQTVVINKMLNKDHNLLLKLMDNKPKVVSKGSPTGQGVDSNKGVDNRVTTKRMSVLNKHLMQTICDVLSSEPIGDDFDDLRVRITQVKVNKRCDSANIYWVSKREDIEEVSTILDQMKGRLCQHLMDRNFTNSLPWIQFVLDTNENQSEEVNRILNKCDFGPQFRPFDKTLFKTPYEVMAKPMDQKTRHKSNEKFENSENVYEYLKLQRPDDMTLDCFGLNYELLINNVLSNLHKSRAQHRSFNAVADPLPPPDWSNTAIIKPNTEDDSFYNTEERIKAMKRFLVENRKKREKLSRIMKRRVILEEMEISCHLNNAFDNYELNAQQFDEDFESNDETNDSLK